MDLLLVKGEPLVTGALGLSYDVSVSIRSATSSGDIAKPRISEALYKSLEARDITCGPLFWLLFLGLC